MSRPRPSRGPRPQLLLALWGAGLVLFNFPLLIVWDRDATLFGLPVLPLALFAIWAGLIGVLAWASERRAPPPASKGEPESRGRASPASR